MARTDANGTVTAAAAPNRWTELAPRLRSIMRIVIALLFMQHGAQKLFGFPAGPEPFPPVHLVSQFGLAGILEFFGGALMALGLFSRPVAFLLAGEMAVAYFQAHFPRGFWPILNHGELPVLFCFTWLYLSAAGPGPWSLDAAVRGRG